MDVQEIIEAREQAMERHAIKSAMKAVCSAHRSIDEAGHHLKGTRLEKQWRDLWSALDVLQAELIAEKVKLGD